MIHVRQGQTVKMTLTNGGAIPHSIDFHAARIAPNMAFRDVDAGESFTFSFKAGDPGVFMYHCGTKPVLMHIANGMYGAIVVEPAKPLPHADREYVLVSSEWYLNAPGLDEPASFDMAKAHAMAPDWVTWNGYAGQYVKHPLTANPGETVRFWVVAAGPSFDTDFHVVGTLLNRAWLDGDMTQYLRNVQTATVPAGGGGVFDVDPGLRRSATRRNLRRHPRQRGRGEHRLLASCAISFRPDLLRLRRAAPPAPRPASAAAADEGAAGRSARADGRARCRLVLAKGPTAARDLAVSPEIDPRRPGRQGEPPRSNRRPREIAGRRRRIASVCKRRARPLGRDGLGRRATFDGRVGPPSRRGSATARAPRRATRPSLASPRTGVTRPRRAGERPRAPIAPGCRSATDVIGASCRPAGARIESTIGA